MLQGGICLPVRVRVKGRYSPLQISKTYVASQVTLMLLGAPLLFSPPLALRSVYADIRLKFIAS